MSEHHLKLSPQWAETIYNGSKRAEVRRHDRDYQAGDRIFFLKPSEGGFLPGSFRVTHVLASSAFPEGIKAGYCVLSLTDWDNHDD